jgi:hypothetical protein
VSTTPKFFNFDLLLENTKLNEGFKSFLKYSKIYPIIDNSQREKCGFFLIFTSEVKSCALAWSWWL